MQAKPRACVGTLNFSILRRKRVGWRLEGWTKSQASSPVPGWQPPQARLKGQVPNGPGYERLVNWIVLRFVQDGTS